MNRTSQTVDLANEADFELGIARVRPAIRQFDAGECKEILEPRVMQVLVVLAQCQGAVLSHDELAARCWDGRIVSEDAIQRPIAKLRRLGKASGIFAINTIRKVGYQLAVSHAATAHGLAAAKMIRTVTGRDSKPSIAVLPFFNRSGAEEDEIFACGMVEDLTSALSLARRMKVLAASASASYRNEPRDVRRIGRELGVQYLLEGNIRRCDGDLRVTAQLVDSDEGDIVWTQRFVRPLSQLAVLQENLVSEVAACLGVEVLRAEIEHALCKPGDITAWEAVLRAEANVSKQTLKATEDAIIEARNAIDIDPGYDAAYAILAIALAMRMLHSGERNSERVNELQDVITKACSFQSNNPLVVSRIGTAMSLLGRVDEALPIIRRAIALNPNLETPHIALGYALSSLGRLDEAIEQFLEADRIAPNGIWSHGPAVWRSVVHFRSGRLSDALTAVEQASQVVPSLMAEAQTVVCLLALRRDNDASVAMRRLVEVVPDATWQAIDNFLRMGPLREDIDAGDESRINMVRQLWNTAICLPPAN